LSLGNNNGKNDNYYLQSNCPFEKSKQVSNLVGSNAVSSINLDQLNVSSSS